MKILVVTQYFWPEPFRINDLCDALVERGHQVTVLTAEPNYPEGKVYSEYKVNKVKYADYKGCEVVRCKIIPRGKGSPIKLILNYFSFVVSASYNIFFKFKNKKFDVIFVCQLSPATVALPAIFYKFLTKTPIVMWVLDLWPESLKEAGGINNQFILNLVSKLMDYIYSRCDLILAQSKLFTLEILDRVKHQDVEYFPNWAEDLFSKEYHFSNSPLKMNSDNLNILFAGNIGESQDFLTVVDAFKIIKAKNLKVKLHIVGDGRTLNWLKKEVKDNNLHKYFEFYGRHPLEAMPSFFHFSDVCLVNLKDSAAFSKTLPGKVQTYLAAGKPIIAALSGEGQAVILESQAGFVSNSGDYKGLAKNIENMVMLSTKELNQLGLNAKEFSEKNYSRSNLIDTFVKKLLYVIKT